MTVGNDISKWQGDVDWNTYKNNSNFVIVKATEGTGYIDTKFTRNQSEARRVGLPLGTYHFARPDLGGSAEVEADFYVKTVGSPIEGEVYCLDYEPNWNGDAVGWCKAFLDRVQLTLKLKPLIYLNQSQVTRYNWQPVVDAGYGLWIAAYTYDPNNNVFQMGAWKFAAMQQWTNSQQVPGISGKVDGDAFFGTTDTFKRYGYQAPTPTPPPPPVEPPVVIPPVTPQPPTTPPTNCCEELNERVTKLENQTIWDILKRKSV